MNVHRQKGHVSDKTCIILSVQPSQLGQQNMLTASLRGVRPNPNECPGYDTKQFNDKTSFLDLWRNVE